MTDLKESEINLKYLVPAQDSATLRISINTQKMNVLASINDLLKERRFLENRRNSMLQSAILRQHQLHELRDKCDMTWHQKLLQAQISGSRIESECIALREKRDAMHKQLVAAIERNVPCRPTHAIPSIRANYKIQASLLQKDIAELKRRVLHTKMRLESEIKAIDNLSNSVKKLRIELGSKKLNSMAIRPQTLALLKHANQCRSSRENFRIGPMRNTYKNTNIIATPGEKQFN